MYTQMSVCTYMYKHLNISVCFYVSNVPMFVCAHTPMHVCSIHVFTCESMYMDPGTSLHLYMDVCICHRCPCTSMTNTQIHVA